METSKSDIQKCIDKHNLNQLYELKDILEDISDQEFNGSLRMEENNRQELYFLIDEVSRKISELINNKD